MLTAFPCWLLRLQVGAVQAFSFSVSLSINQIGLMCYLVLRPTNQQLGSTSVLTAAQMTQRCNELFASLSPPCPLPSPLGPFNTTRRLLGPAASSYPSAPVTALVDNGSYTSVCTAGLCSELTGGFFQVTDISSPQQLALSSELTASC